MKIFLVVCFAVMNVCLHAQDTTAATAKKIDSIEAKFPGGQDAWRNFLIQHIHSSVAAKHKAPVGNYTVTISFLVDKTGKVTQVQALTDPGYGTAEDAVNVVEHSPAWMPATIGGNPVIYRQKQNFTYQVTEK